MDIRAVMIIQPMIQTAFAEPQTAAPSASAAPAASAVADLLQGMAPVEDLGVILVEGADAVSFLQGQLTQDFALLEMEQARLAAFCSAKGRMQASFIGFKRSPSEIMLLCQRDLLEATLKRLRMFVLRAKVRLSDASATFQVRGLLGNAIDSVAVRDCSAWSREQIGDADLVGLYPAAGVRRALWIAPLETPAPALASLDTSLWAWSEVLAGVATVSAATAEAFVPQMLNFESVGGVNFKKGCYPGQEVVARSQFRGTLKRRGYLLHGDAPMAVADEVFSDADPEQPCGSLAQVAASPFGGFHAIASLQVAAAEAGGLRLADGTALELLPLPYELLQDI